MLCPRPTLLNPRATPAVLTQHHRQRPSRGAGSCTGHSPTLQTPSAITGFLGELQLCQHARRHLRSQLGLPVRFSAIGR